MHKTDKMTTTFEKYSNRCPHCGAEPFDDDDLCKFCGKVMIPVESVKSISQMVSSRLRSLKTKARPLSIEEIDELSVTADLSNPAHPAWDDL